MSTVIYTGMMACLQVGFSLTSIEVSPIFNPVFLHFLSVCLHLPSCLHLFPPILSSLLHV